MKTYNSNSKNKTAKTCFSNLLLRTDPEPKKNKEESLQAFLTLFNKANTSLSNHKSAATNKVTKKTQSKPLVQSILNFGQKQAVRLCSECQMEFNPAHQEDLTLHKKYHAGVMNALSWNMELKNDNIVHISPPNAHNGKVWKKAIEILRIVNDCLGAAHQTIAELQNYQVVLYVQNKKILGCVVARPIKVSYRVMPVKYSEDAIKDQLLNVYYDKENPQSLAYCGISRIWTAVSARKRGIATKLLDAIRSLFVFGHEISKESLAFSQPTDLGQKLALCYFNRPDYLLYIEE